MVVVAVFRINILRARAIIAIIFDPLEPQLVPF